MAVVRHGADREGKGSRRERMREKRRGELDEDMVETEDDWRDEGDGTRYNMHDWERGREEERKRRDRGGRRGRWRGACMRIDLVGGEDHGECSRQKDRKRM